MTGGTHLGSAARSGSGRRPAAALARLACAALLLVTGTAQAQRADPEAMEALAKRLFYRMDMDKNGEVSREEYLHTRGAGFMVDFDLLDRDGDQVLTWSEYLAAVRHFHPGGPPRQSL